MLPETMTFQWFLLKILATQEIPEQQLNRYLNGKKVIETGILYSSCSFSLCIFCDPPFRISFFD